MKKRGAFFTLFMILTCVILLVYRAAAQDSSATEEPATEPTAEATADADLLARGEYLVHVGACVDCHTPYKPEYADPTKLTMEQIQTLSMNVLDAQDTENMMLAGGRPFDLGPAGVLYSRNLTSDKETGIGNWSDQEIENAIRIGVRPDGSRLHPLMPYRNFYNMSRYDMKALIAYLRTLAPVSNEIERTVTGDGIAPELAPSPELLETAPDASDPVALGGYLVNTLMSCGDCHTPLDPETGAPLLDQNLAGGQPFEGPWGIVYGANITPDEATGIGAWTHDELVRVFREGVRIDNRRVILMPWQAYGEITDADLDAVVTYLKEGVTPVNNEIPLPSIEDAFLQTVESK